MIALTWQAIALIALLCWVGLAVGGWLIFGVIFHKVWKDTKDDFKRPPRH